LEERKSKVFTGAKGGKKKQCNGPSTKKKKGHSQRNLGICMRARFVERDGWKRIVGAGARGVSRLRRG